MNRSGGRSLLLSIVLVSTGLVRSAYGQDVDQPETPVVTADTATRIRAALDAEHLVDFRMPHFYAEVSGKQPMAIDALKLTDLQFHLTAPSLPIDAAGPRPASGGVGFDPMQVVNWIHARVRETKVRKIQARIDRELKALSGEE